MKTNVRRWLAMFLCLVMTLSLLPAMAVSALADAAVPADSAAGTNDQQDVDSTVPDGDLNEDAAGADASNGEENVPPDGDQPDDVQPGGDQPDAGQPDVGQPDAGQPDAGQPDADQPDAGQPDAGQPDAGQPDGGQPDADQPDAGQPDAGQPDADQPDADQPDGANGILDDADSGIALLWDENLPDGALVDEWKQDPQTVRGDGSVCEVTDEGHLHLKVGTGNTNNGDQWTGETAGTGPAVFVSDVMKADLKPGDDGNYTVSFKVKPLVDGICFGVYVNYKNPNGGMLMGYNTPGAWFWQKYGGGGAYSTNTLPGPSTLVNGTTYDVELTWNPTAKTYTYKMGETGGALTAVVTDLSYAEVANAEAIGVINNIGIKLGKSNAGVLGEVEVWDLHYSGQKSAELPDGALVDEWKQDPQTVRGDGSVCEVNNEGHLHLKVGTGNTNNGDQWTGETAGTGPAVFVSDLMKADLKPGNDGNYKVSFKVKPLVEGICFGVYVNYKNPNAGMLMGYNTPGAWFWQKYGGGGAYSTNTLPGPSTLVNGTTYDVELTWNPTAKTYTYKMGETGGALTAVVTDQSYAEVADAAAIGVINNIGIKLGKSNAGVLGEVEVWDLHYSGQNPNKRPDPTYTVSGKVTDADGIAIAGATVTLDTKTATTNAKGEYSFANVKAGGHSMTAAAEDYKDSTATVTVGSEDVTQNFTLQRIDSKEVYDDGVTNDTWKRDEQTNAGKTDNDDWICALDENGQMHVKSGPKDGNGSTPGSPSDWPGVFYNETANEALAAVPEGENRWMEMTFVRAEGSTPRFGFYFNYGGPCDGFFIGCNSDTSGWFWQNYCVEDSYSGGTGSTPTAGKEVTVRAEWNDTKVVSFAVDGTVLYRNLDIAGSGTGVSLRLTSWRGARADYYIKEMHYSGQDTTDVYNVSGTVKDKTSSEALEGVTVSAGKYTATTASNGKYNLLLPAGTHTITAKLDGYDDTSITAEVGTSALTGQDISMQKLATVSGKVTEKVGNGEGDPIIGAAVTLTKTDDATVVKTGATKADGTYSIIGVPNGEYTVTVSCEGYEDNTTVANVTVSNYTDVTGVNAALTVHEIPSVELSTAAMTVKVATGFPQVIKYTMINDNSVMWGQSAELNTLKLNGVEVHPAVTSTVSPETKTITYVMTVDDGNNNNSNTNLNVKITAHITVGIEGDNTLGFFLDSVEYLKGESDRLVNPLETIEIPNHSLVSVRSTETGAAVTGANPGGSTYTNGDVTYEAAKNVGLDWTGNYFAGFVYNDKFSAGLASNSEYGSGNGGSNNYPVRVTFEPKNGGAVESIGLSSTLWYWDRKVSSVNSGVWENAYIPTEKKVIGPTDSEKGYAKVSIAVGNQNGDDKVDWQDGAIVYRDTVMHKPANSGADGTGLVGIRDAVSMRINLNFGSQAQHPFLMSLDNVKRMALSTDGLGQLVLMKGYAGEGHDSNHPDYYDIGERMGGVDDFNTMLEEGKELGAQFGIHVNASEFYPEADAFDDKTVGRKDSALEGGTLKPGALRYGWNWIDQGINMNVLYDFASGNRENRFQKLYDLVGNNLSFVYVDVWGNNQHGVGEDAWMTRKLTNEITEVKNNESGKSTWRIAHEWSYCNPYDSTFQHWTSDYTYGNGNYKGHNNSNVLRFLLNSYRDSFPADFATFGGACNAPLLGGPSMQGFEGWQGDDEYDLAVENTFNQMIATKFLQHFDIVEWINADNEVTIPYNLNANNLRTSTDKKWTPEMQITLTDGNKEVVVTRGLDSTLDESASFSLDKEVEYRSRVITYDGKVILKGAPASAGEDKAFPESKATQQYLIPWFWNAQGETTPDPAQVKLYHWNAQGGSSEWDVSYIWSGQNSAILYELSDQGRINPQTLTITGGKITLPASVKANTGYVVVLNESNQGPQVNWSTPGMHVDDASFNIDLPNTYWTATGEAARVRNPGGISALELTGDASVKQVMDELTAGQKYVAYVGVDNLSSAKAAITITDETGKVVASNYTLESIATNYVSGYGLHTAAGLETTGGFRSGRESRFQNMYVFFTPEAGHTYTMTLSHESSGEVETKDKAYFAGVRVLETEANNIEYDAEGNITKFTQDFEHVAQGMYPFVVSGIEGTTDNRQHLSELHAPYTQAGWDKKLMDDVLEGHWSVKVNGLTQGNTLVFQTIPQNVRFEPDETYFVSFKYQMGSEGIYKVVIGDGKYTGLSGLKQIDLEQGMGPDQDNTCSFVITGSQTGQTWFGIYSTGEAPAVNDSFTGHKEIVVDDLVIQRSTVDRTALNKAIDTALAMNLDDYVPAEGIEQTEEALFAALATALEDAQAVQVNPEATKEQIDAATAALNAAMAKLVKINVTISGTVTDENGNPVAGATVTLEDSNYMPVGNDVEMPGSAGDGSANTEGVARGYTWHKGLTATTGADGKYSFASTGDMFLGADDYKVKVQKDGYNVTTVDASVTKTAPNGTGDAVLFAEAEAVYTNNFDGGDVSMIGPFDNWINEDGTIKDGLDFGVWSNVHNDSNAVATRFRAFNDSVMPSSNGRKANNMLVKEDLAKIANGTISFDVTLPDSPVRFGITLRGATDEQRIYIGQGSNSRIWFVEWWNNGGNDWSSNYSVPIGMDTGVTRRVKITMQDSNYTVWIDGVHILEGVFDAGAPTDPGFFGINMQGISGTNWNSRAIVDNIRVSTVDISELRALYGKLSAEENDGYTNESWEAFQTALNEAKAVLDKSGATQSEIDTARKNLQNAFDGLTKPYVDVTAVRVYKDGVQVNENTLLRVYTNNDHDGHTHNHTLTLTADVLPENATNKDVYWKRTEVSGMVALSRNGNRLTITAIHDEAETNVGEVKLNVYAAADESIYQPITVQVFRVLENNVTISIQGVNDPTVAPKFGQTLEADINQLKMTNEGKAALTYQWIRTKDGNATIISGANSKTYTLTAEDIGATISVEVTADEATFYEGTRTATRSQTVEKADGPNIPGSLICGEMPTTAANSDGKITGFGTDFGRYEYRNRDGGAWTDVTGLEVTGLTNGEYQVRIKETETHKAGLAINVTVPPFNSNYKRINIAANMVNGTITRSVGQAEPETAITLTVRPDAGYKLVNLTVTTASGSIVDTIKGDDITEDGKTYETYLFRLPNENVTVSATFGKLRLTITHVLEHLTCSKGAGNDKHEVDYGETAAITLVPDEGYALPAGEAIVITNANGVAITGWTLDRTTGTITITGGVTSDLTITAKGVVRNYVVNYTLTGGLSAPETGAPRQVAYKAAYTGTLVAASGYMLPESISITMGGEEFTDFTYENGTLTIPEGKITGNLVITASGTYDGGDSSSSGDETTLPPTSTEEKENPDGSITTIVTDNKTGTVTETTEMPDGTKVIVETKKNGTVTETTEKPDGSKEIVETKKDGTVTETSEKADGSKEIVETKPDGTVTETKVDTEGGEVAKVTDPDKNVEIKVTDPSGDVLAEVKLPAEIPVPENRFVDVPKNHWADEAVHEMAGLGLVNGVGDNKFDMSSNMKRGDLALILSRLSNAKADYELTFTDVPADKYYANGVAWAAKSGVVTGRSADKFDPEATITRGELAIMLYRYAKLLKMDTTASADALDAFKDGSASPDWAVDGLAWCVKNGILKGKGGGILDSTATTTRAEVAVMLQRFVNLMK